MKLIIGIAVTFIVSIVCVQMLPNNKEVIKLNDLIKSKYQTKREPRIEEGQINVTFLGDNDDQHFSKISPPQRRHIRKRKLKKLFWKYKLDTTWQSIEKPTQLTGVMDEDGVNANKGLEKAAKNLNFTFTDKAGTFLEMPTDIQTKFKSWLVAYSTCRTFYQWNDLGKLFWPRFIRRGSCGYQNSCSWPPGMGCKLTNSRILYILRWKCVLDPNEKHKREHENFMNRRQKRKRNRERRKFRKLKRRSLTDKKKLRRSIRIVNELSRPVNGFFCYWSMTSYTIRDQCACKC